MMYQSHTPQSVAHFEKIGQIAITVEDLAKAKEFYQNTLGMRFLFDAGHLVFFQCGDIRLMVSEGKRAESAGPHGDTVIYFKVEDLQAVYADLSGRGVPFLEAPHLIATMPDHDLWMAFLKDPDGNVLGVMCEVPRPDRPEFMPVP